MGSVFRRPERGGFPGIRPRVPQDIGGNDLAAQETTGECCLRAILAMAQGQSPGNDHVLNPEVFVSSDRRWVARYSVTDLTTSSSKQPQRGRGVQPRCVCASRKER
jgi:hypothetical protein